MIKQGLLEKLLKKGTADTKLYRYILDGRTVKRIPKRFLNTTCAIDRDDNPLNEWEIVTRL